MQTNVHIDTKNLKNSPEHGLKNSSLSQRAIEQQSAPDKSQQELVVSSPSERNWRGIFIAILVIVAVLGLIIFSIILVSPPEEGPRIRGRKPSVEELFVKFPPPAKFNGTWISDSEFVYMDVHGGVSIYNADNLTSKILMTNSTFRQYNAVEFFISGDLKYILLLFDAVKVYKYSRLARYRIYELSTRIVKPLSPIELDTNAPLLQYAVWSPSGNSLAFVHENDIHYRPRIHKDLICKITKSGSNSVFNGVPDWMYEEQILKSNHALWFSSDSLYLLYLTFNDTNVGEYVYPNYNTKGENVWIREVRYPKVATANPEVTAWVVNLTTPKFLFPIQLEPPASVEPGSYITSVSFFGEHDVAIVWLNRRQNISVIATCYGKNNFNCTEFKVEKESTEPIFHPVFSKNGTQALVRLPVKDGDNGDFMHACQLQWENVFPLTHGPFEVTRILAWDEENHLIYAMATTDNNPRVRHLFKIGDLNSTQPWTCLTCNFTEDVNTTSWDGANETMTNQCSYNNVIFSAQLKYYVQECLGPDVPVIYLVETSTNTKISVLDAGNALRNKVRGLSAPRIQSFQVLMDTEKKYTAQVKLYLPPVLREYEDVVFPFIVYLNSELGEQSVSDKWELDWPWYLASTRHYIVAKIDVRGSGYQGENMKRALRMNIGILDVKDQLAVLTYLRDTFKFIDKSKLCVVGTGYGGYITAMLLMQDIQFVINCSVSISPITNWMYYSSYLAERYLGFPSDEGMYHYISADLTKRASNLNDRNFLLIHGTADTTIHPQHSMMLSMALIDEEMLFQQTMYPDERHDFSKKSLVHMYKQIDRFFNDSFGPNYESWEDSTEFFIS